jgi:hypothetical protein
MRSWYSAFGEKSFSHAVNRRRRKLRVTADFTDYTDYFIDVAVSLIPAYSVNITIPPSPGKAIRGACNIGRRGEGEKGRRKEGEIGATFFPSPLLPFSPSYE